MTKYVSKGQGQFDFYVHWNNVATKDAYIKAAGAGGTPTTLKIEITNVLNELTLNGPDKLSRLEIGTYSINSSCGTVNNVAWSINSDKAKIAEAKENVAKVQALAGGIDVVLTAQIKNQNNNVLRTLTKTIVLESTFNIVGPDIICSNISNVFSISHIEEAPDAKITWTATSNATLQSGQGTPNATFKGVGNGNAEIRAVIVYKGKTFTIQKTFWVGPPALFRPPTANGPLCLNIRDDVKATIKLEMKGLNRTYDYKWEKGSGKRFEFLTKTSNYAIVQPLEIGQIAILYSANNQCGWSGPVIILRDVAMCNSNEWVMKSALDDVADSEPSTASIRIYSLTTGSVVYTEKNIMNFNIENTGLKKGIYVLEKTDGEGNVTRIKVAKQ
ncbi:T9SS type A sorting domain-containing protein [Dysgonomonas sp. ZJ279]|uniref:T9SS type A sorting domain-containing protein n=1 Tax=Dysgonomonas sp. ZJ279 TaxID=2709796 RepID=UPI001C87D807|nr:T9SS type A sorting domain-containing protein [Dysgonomonas sp. ZJ279]